MKTQNPKEVVVLGAGNWVKDQYAPALKRHFDRQQCGVHFIYDTSFAAQVGLPDQNVQEYNRRTLVNIAEFESWGADCIDLGSAKAARADALDPDILFVVTPDRTHCDMVEKWLERAKTIIVEKPFDVDPDKIRRLRPSMKKDQVWGFDHYLVRANQFYRMREFLDLNKHLQRRISGFKCRLLEASGDESLKAREASLQEGMIMDLGSHIAAMVLPFGDPNTIRVNEVVAGVYRKNPKKGIHTNGRELLKSGNETFAEIHFNFTSNYGDNVEAVADIGKCVGEHDEKFVEVIGGKRGDRRVLLDLTNYIVDFINGKHVTPVTSLFTQPVHLLVREVLAGRHPASLALFDPAVGQDIVSRLLEWRRPIRDHIASGRSLGEYLARDSLDKVLPSSTRV